MISHAASDQKVTQTRESPTLDSGQSPGQSSGAAEFLPVFAGFEQLGLTGRDVARLADVSPPTVSKWRRALVNIPGPKLAFLTLVLAHLLEDAKTLGGLEAMLSTEPATWGESKRQGAEAAAKALKVQESLNLVQVTPAEVRAGSHRFRDWWATGGADELQANWAKSTGQMNGRTKGSST